MAYNEGQGYYIDSLQLRLTVLCAGGAAAAAEILITGPVIEATTHRVLLFSSALYPYKGNDERAR